MRRYDLLPTYHYEINTNGVVNEPAVSELRDYTIHGADGGVGTLNKNIADITKFGAYMGSNGRPVGEYWIAGRISNIDPETGSFDVVAKSGMYGVKLSLLFPDMVADKEYYLFATSPTSQHKGCYLYGNGRMWTYGTKQTISQADLDAVNGLGIYGATDGSVTHYSGFMIVPAELYDANNTAFEPYMTPGKYNIPINVSENLIDTSAITSARDWTYTVERSTYYSFNGDEIVSRIGAYGDGAVLYDTKTTLLPDTYTLAADFYVDKDSGDKNITIGVYDFVNSKLTAERRLLTEYKQWESVSYNFTLTDSVEMGVVVQGVGTKDDYLNLKIKIRNIRLISQSRSETIYVLTDNSISSGTHIKMSENALPPIQLPYKRNIITVKSTVRPSAIEYQYYKY